MAAIIEALREEHRNISRLLDALNHQIEVFAQAGDPDYDVVRGIAEYFVDYPDQFHHPKENIIFSRLMGSYPGEASSIVDLLEEHKLVHQRVIQFRDTVNILLNESDIARETVVRTARQFIELERRHMQKEEDHFLPLAEQLLTSDDWVHIEGMLAAKADPLFGESAEEKFKLLRERLLAWESEYQQDPDPP